ncbi:MAG: hypothetical protein AAF561_05380 [Planctomycetota bacterium]
MEEKLERWLIGYIPKLIVSYSCLASVSTATAFGFVFLLGPRDAYDTAWDAAITNLLLLVIIAAFTAFTPKANLWAVVVLLSVLQLIWLPLLVIGTGLAGMAG